MLAAFEHSHSQDVNVLWLYGQTAYWAGHYKTFNSVYKKAMNRFPSNYYLKLDYALKLLENGDIQQAVPLLETYKKYDPSSNDVKLAQARIAYWEGNYETALQLLKNEALLNEKQKQTEQLQAEVMAASSPWLKLRADYLKDDQPLQVMTPAVEAGAYINPFLNPSLSFSDAAFKTDSASMASQRIAIGNKFNFYKAGVRLAIEGGFVQLPNKEKTVTGSIDITKTCFRYLQLSGQAALQPYLVTLSSISNTIVPAHVALSTGWNNLNSWNGKVASSIDYFSKDKNRIYNISAWVFTPPVIVQMFQFRLGYAYAYSNSKENRYMQKKNLSEIIAGYATTPTIAGSYNPYFTPADQQVHSVLLNLTFNQNNPLQVGATAAIGFFGKTDDPYLFLNKNKNNEVFVSRGYSRVNFYPTKIDVFVLYKIAKKVSLKTSYAFLKNNFYMCHSAGLSVVINFWNDQSKK